MARKRVLILPAILLLLLAGVREVAAAKPPNILFLFADDMRSDSIAALGNPIVKTPTLDSLVKRGFVFHNAYCLGGNSAAVCTPSRNMLLSGKTYFRWQGSLAPADPPNFPLSLRDGGYLTYHQGKQGNSALNIQAKFEINKYIHEDADRTSGEPGKEIADEVITFLREKHDQRPFFMYLAFGNPHDPRVADKKYMDLYDRDKIPLPKNFRPVHPFDNGELTVRDERLLPWPRTPADVRGQLHEYYAVITAMDVHIGRILATLRELGLEDNTIIIFSADQGIAIGSHGLLGKQNLYDVGMKVPLFFAGPGIPRGGSDALVYLHDIYPTVCDLVGAAPPAGIDGLSFRPVIEGRVKSVRRDLFFAYRSVQRAVRDERWKLIRYPEINFTQLFDLKNDPQELKNLAAELKQTDRIKALTGSLAAWQAKLGDGQSLRTDKPKPMEINLGKPDAR